MAERVKGISLKITGGLRSALELRARLDQCVEIQTRICERAVADPAAQEQAQKTLDLLQAVIDSNASDIVKCEEIVSRHRRAYRLSKKAFPLA